MLLNGGAGTWNALLVVAVTMVTVGIIYLLRIHVALQMARNRHRKALGWVLLSFFFSPLLTWIILLIVGDSRDQYNRPEER